MNERMKELRAKAQELAGQEHQTGQTNGYFLVRLDEEQDFQIFMDRVHTSYEKFAELIVRECAEYMNQFADNGDQRNSNDLLKHFGVEE